MEAADDVALVTGGLATADRPLLTYYDDATGERTELTAAALAAWAARTAGLLHEGCGLGVGSRGAVLLPPHWQTAAVLLGAWSVGMAVSFRSTATAGLPALGPRVDEPFDATFVALDRLDNWLEDVPAAHHAFVLRLGAAGAAPGEVPDGYRDFIAEVGRYPASLPAYAMIGRSAPATVDGTTYRQWGRLAREIADSLGLRATDRLLVDAGEHEHPLKWLLAPLSVGASVVVCANLDPAQVPGRVKAERVTRVL